MGPGDGGDRGGWSLPLQLCRLGNFDQKVSQKLFWTNHWQCFSDFQVHMDYLGSCENADYNLVGLG